MNAILMVAYHYPPEGSSSGVLRTLKFTKYLPEFGWQPHVLTLRASAYPVRDDGLLRDVPSNVTVHRTHGFDASRRLALRRRHLGILSVPDQYVSWLPYGIASGLRIIRTSEIRALFSTSPKPTAHLIAGALAVTRKLPWLADFRDPWIEEGAYPPPDTLRYRVERALEAFVIRRASRVIVTTEEFRRQLLSRYPDLSADRIVAIYNGYDEADFAHVRWPERPAVFEILHTGLVTPEYRNPLPLLRAVKRGAERGDLDLARTRVTFLGGGEYVRSAAFENAVNLLGIRVVVRVVERVPYWATLQRMGEAAVLLLLQASDDTKALIPAKTFEYLRVGRPVLALTLEGATAELISRTAAGFVVEPDDDGALDRSLTSLYRAWQAGASPTSIPSLVVRRFDRRLLTAELARLLGEITRPHPTPAMEQPGSTTFAKVTAP